MGNIPETYKEFVVMPKVQKDFYIASLQANIDYLLEPCYQNIIKSNKEIYIPFDKKLLSTAINNSEEGKLFYTITLPKGITLHGEDVSGCTIHPKEVEPSPDDPSKIIAIFKNDKEELFEIGLNYNGIRQEKINADELKVALDEYNQKSQEQVKEKSEQVDINRQRQPERGSDEEL